MSTRQQQLSKNVDFVRERIRAAAEKAGRDPDSVRLVAVTKYVDADVTRDLVAAGCEDLGESRPQTLWPKADSLADLPIRWHQIGHLQRNKLRKTLPHISLVHSVDSLRLLDAIDSLQAELDAGTPKPILLEVNTSGDEAKHGFREESLDEAMQSVAAKQHVQLNGLMCMAGLGTSPVEAGRDFAKLREIRDRLQSQYADFDLRELSMGMSSDYEAAIEEGATLVRVGSRLFEGIDR